MIYDFDIKELIAIEKEEENFNLFFNDYDEKEINLNLSYDNLLNLYFKIKVLLNSEDI